jgi:hypothetical protein
LGLAILKAMDFLPANIFGKLLGNSDISITASTYAHLDIEHIRAEVGINTAHLLGVFEEESKVDRLEREIE